MEGLFDPADVRVIQDRAGAGRTLACARRFEAGELLFQSVPLGIAILPRYAHCWCAFCLGFYGDDRKQLRIDCKVCRHVYYCSEFCRDAHKEIHYRQCALLKALRDDSKTNLSQSEVMQVLWLADVWATQPSNVSLGSYCEESRRRWAMTCKPCSLRHAPSGRCPGAQDFSRQRQLAAKSHTRTDPECEMRGPPIAKVDHLNLLVEDEPRISGYATRSKERSRVARAFVRAFAETRNARNKIRTTCNANVFASDHLQQCVSELDMTECREHEEFGVELLERLLSRGQRNDFGLFDLAGIEHGKVEFPAVAMLNSSCVPNAALRLEGRLMCVYALAPLDPGSSLFISYANLATESKERQRAIKRVWGFDCPCDRCLDQNCEAIAEFDKQHVCRCGGVQVPEAPDPAKLVLGHHASWWRHDHASEAEEEEEEEDEEEEKLIGPGRNVFNLLVSSDEDEDNEDDDVAT